MDFSLSEEQVQFQQVARDFARNEIIPRAEHYDDTCEFPHEIVKKARELGFTSLNVPVERGGAGLGPMEVALVAEELAYGCAGIATAITLNTLVADAVELGGNEEQKERGFQALAEGFGAYCLTEPGAGSDAAAIATKAVKTEDGGYRLTGSKTWISHAPQANIMVVFAKTDVESGHRGISAFLVDAKAEGVSVGNPLPKMGQKASPCAEVSFDDVKLGADALMGAEGEGFKLAMKVFDRSRPMVASVAVGVARRCLEESTQYACQRKSMGVPIATHQAVGFKLAEMGMKTEAARQLVRLAAWKLQSGKSNTLEAAYAKAFAADTAMECAVEAVQVFGGYGYSKEYPVEKLMRDAKVLQIYEGTSEIQRAIMVRELTRRFGAKRG
jgi:acyl-CoA dehydrogenase